MRKTDLIGLLHSEDEETAIRIAEEFPPFSEQENERIFRRIKESVEMQQELPEETLVISRVSHVQELRRIVSAAACLLMLCGTFGGLFWLKTQMPQPPEQYEATEAAVHSTPSHRIGERYAAVNLTSSGTLWLTVEEAGMMQEQLYCVRIKLESRHARSHARSSSTLFQADNFMLAVGQEGELWNTIRPCGIRTDKDEACPYAFTLESGKTIELTLYYPLEQPPEEMFFVTSYCAKQPFTVLAEKPDPETE